MKISTKATLRNSPTPPRIETFDSFINRSFVDTCLSLTSNPRCIFLEPGFKRGKGLATPVCILDHSSAGYFGAQLAKRLSQETMPGLLKNPVPLFSPWGPDAPHTEGSEIEAGYLSKYEQAIFLKQSGLAALQPAFFEPGRVGGFKIPRYGRSAYLSAPLVDSCIKNNLERFFEVESNNELMLLWHNGCALVVKSEHGFHLDFRQNLPEERVELAKEFPRSKFWKLATDSVAHFDGHTLNQVCSFLGRFHVVLDAQKYMTHLGQMRLKHTLDELAQIDKFDIYIKPSEGSGGKGVVRVLKDSKKIDIQFPANAVEEASRRGLAEIESHKPLSDIMLKLFASDAKYGRVFIQANNMPALLNGHFFEPRLIFAGHNDHVRLLAQGAKLGQDAIVGNISQGGERIPVEEGIRTLFAGRFADAGKDIIESHVTAAMQNLQETAQSIAAAFNQQGRSADRSIKYICLDFQPKWTSTDGLQWKFLERNPIGSPETTVVDEPRRYEAALKLYKKNK